MNNKFLTLCCALALGTAFQTAQAAPDLLQQFPIKGGAAQGKAPRKRGAAQSQVALKSAFPTVSKGQLTGALDAKSLSTATKAIGKSAVFTGVVVDIYAPKSGAIVLLNFAKDYKSALMGSVKAKDFRLFPDLKSLKGKRVALKGKVVLYKGQPELELTQSGAIRLVK